MHRFENKEKVVLSTKNAELTFHKDLLDTYITFGLNQTNLTKEVNKLKKAVLKDFAIAKNVYSQKIDYLDIRFETKPEFEGRFEKEDDKNFCETVIFSQETMFQLLFTKELNENDWADFSPASGFTVDGLSISYFQDLSEDAVLFVRKNDFIIASFKAKSVKNSKVKHLEIQDKKAFSEMIDLYYS